MEATIWYGTDSDYTDFDSVSKVTVDSNGWLRIDDDEGPSYFRIRGIAGFSIIKNGKTKEVSNPDGTRVWFDE